MLHPSLRYLVSFGLLGSNDGSPCTAYVVSSHLTQGATYAGYKCGQGQIQRNVKRGVEAGFYARFLALNGIAVGTEDDVVPRINFGKEPTGTEDVNIADFLRAGVDSFYIQRPQYFKILKDLGLEIDFEEEPIPEIPPEIPGQDDNGDDDEVLQE